jgi:hypothetical protein
VAKKLRQTIVLLRQLHCAIHHGCLPLIVQGTNWGSAAYNLDRLTCVDEVTALDVTDSYIAIQYHVEPLIDIYDAKTKQKLFQLEGI